MYSIVGELCFKIAKWLLLPWAVAAGIVRRAPQSHDCWSFYNMCQKMREGEIDDDRGMAKEFESMVWLQKLGGRQMLRDSWKTVQINRIWKWQQNF